MSFDILVSKRFKSFVEAKSYLLTEDVYSAINSGTIVSISADGELFLNDFNPKSAVKIMGFDGSISRSAGSGDIVGFAYSRDGRRIPLRIQKVHSVPIRGTKRLTVRKCNVAARL